MERRLIDFEKARKDVMEILAGKVTTPVAIKVAIAMQEATVQQWIPVAERLPKKITNKVIVRCQNNYIGFGHYSDHKGKQTWYNLENDRPFTDWDMEDCESYAVTHWMPLPEPPKGE